MYFTAFPGLLVAKSSAVYSTKVHPLAVALATIGPCLANVKTLPGLAKREEVDCTWNRINFDVPVDKCAGLSWPCLG
ncbi:uncharacterized protein L3040_008706 [Drepanopeziza brunnea f. sp. 'multigermtubi']|uniref:uncharacterized protein n=1 Tax=Drepanopeziza brunnea f. sp. 'multigermtubi' TaxID=698441 RepID=UPI0023886884|nr:hypothetical protein L3040_008706 [Drepanopeziza brunnea f. sp. 'multigermtubi']